MLPPGAQKIVAFVEAKLYRAALGLEPGASLAEVNRAHLRLLATWKDYPEVVEALNRAKVAIRASATAAPAQAPATATPAQARATATPAQAPAERKTAPPPRPVAAPPEPVATPTPKPVAPAAPLRAAEPRPAPAAPSQATEPRPAPAGADAAEAKAGDVVLFTPASGFWGAIGAVLMFLPVRLALAVVGGVVVAVMPGEAVKWILGGLALTMVVSAKSREGVESAGFVASVFAFAGVGFYLAVSTILAARSAWSPGLRATVAAVSGVVLAFVPGMFLVKEAGARLGRPTVLRTLAFVGALSTATFGWAHLVFTPGVAAAARTIPALLLGYFRGLPALADPKSAAVVIEPVMPPGTAGWLLHAGLGLGRLVILSAVAAPVCLLSSGQRTFRRLIDLPLAKFAWPLLVGLAVGAAVLELVYYIPGIGPYLGYMPGQPNTPLPPVLSTVAGVFLYLIPQYAIILPFFALGSRVGEPAGKTNPWTQLAGYLIAAGGMCVAVPLTNALLGAFHVSTPFATSFSNFFLELLARLAGG